MRAANVYQPLLLIIVEDEGPKLDRLSERSVL